LGTSAKECNGHSPVATRKSWVTWEVGRRSKTTRECPSHSHVAVRSSWRIWEVGRRKETTWKCPSHSHIALRSSWRSQGRQIVASMVAKLGRTVVSHDRT
jgi:hypothetical protein